LKFDPKVVKVTAITAGSILPATGEAVPTVTPVIDASGKCVITVSSRYGKASFKGFGPLLFIDVEAIGVGDASLVFEQDTLHLLAADSRSVTSKVIQGTATVKQ